MEYLDIYDENGKFLGTEERGVVHSKGLWHKTVHCWLYDCDGNVFFQRRSDRGTLYTTSSGHLSAGESVTEAFQREIKEEIGLDIDASDATKVGVVPFQMDRVKEDGSIFKDRAFANVYVDLYEGNYEVRKGLIYGPFIPVYGIGMLAYHIILSNMKLEKFNKYNELKKGLIQSMFI